MELVAPAVLGLFAIGYFVRGGADVGAGMLAPLLGRNATERRVVLAAIVPFVLVDEVWLAATAGVLVAGFPGLAGQLVGGLLPATIALLAGCLVRDGGLWLRGGSGTPGRQLLCDAAVACGSWTVAVSWGWMFAGLLAGVTDRLVTGPAAVLVAIAIATLFAAHGLAFLPLRLSGSMRERSRAWSGSSGDVRTFALTSAAMATVCLAAGFRLSPAASAVDSTALRVAVPAALVTAALLVVAEVWVWRTSGQRGRGPRCL